MKATSKFKEIFSDMKVETAKSWHKTTCSFSHNDRKKESNKKFCRGRCYV